MRSLKIQARTKPEADCLARELASYLPKQSEKTLWIDLSPDDPGSYLGDLPSAIETCLASNDIPTVKVKLDGNAYLLEAQRLLPPAPA